MAAHLSYGRVNLNVLREAVRRELREFLDKCAGSKEHEVEKMFTLKGSRLPAADVKNIIFFVRPRLELMDIIAENVLSEDRRGPARDFHILFVPRRSLLCEQRLKDLGVLGSFIHREEYSLDLIPFDGDLLSMESEGAFKECYLESDQTSLYHAAKGLMTLQALYGTIPQIFGKGECARYLPCLMGLPFPPFQERHNAKTVGEIKQFVSQLPHMQAARGSLANHTSIAELIKDVTTSEDFFDKLTVEQEFMSGIDTDKVNSYIEDCIAQKHPLIKVLRLVCLQSVCNSGLKQKVLDYYKREILQTYGYEHILTLYNLEKAGLLKPQMGGRNNYPTIRKTLRLWMDDVNEQNPTDISYVYSGYAPLSVRLAQLLSRPGWRSIEEVLRILPGPHFEERQPLPTGLQKKRQPGENRVTLIFFLGGVTFAEIAALRFLSQLEDGGTEYVIATTKLMNGASWIESLMEKPF
ncbi:vacuolar protein sorting-associated protein 33A [Leptonychotes weddellii]|uniref:Vacuolar protein sorting-associated protein 33A n=1 Tax=Leptonychotes weddellii TaxID=9713 RepID=A0A7F8RLD6_LEPWE|nr:vacuolar protein sorting-associated protein 33A [Leptonychotes weddellii]